MYVHYGAGAYICGEETALFASIEGYRGEPRQKPPFPTESGVFGKPTGINNIETLLAALHVVDVGGDAFAAIGTGQSTGPKLFCVSGAVDRPGVYEVPFGTPLGDLLDLAGGIRDGLGLGAVLMGGAAGVFADASALQIPLTFEDTRAAGTTLGSGSIVFFDDQTDFGPVLVSSGTSRAGNASPAASGRSARKRPWPGCRPTHPPHRRRRRERFSAISRG